MINRNSLKLGVLAMAAYALLSTSARAESVSADDLDTTWNFHGMGLKKAERGMLYMEEAPGSQGVMIVSPEPYPANIQVTYEVMPMTAASVCVLVLSASDSGDGTSLTLPADYDGSMGHWIQNIKNYFFAFHNASHNRPPFARRFPEKTLIGEHPKNVMMSGKFHTIEAGRQNGKLWLKIDGKLVIEGRDPDPLGPGHLAFRIRGLSEAPASCLIRNVVIKD